jgi:aryl-alcohol dehydrogenase-like predicted oxidoreductase
MSNASATDIRPHTPGSTRHLGNSDLQLTAIGFGAWAIGGGDWQYAWGPQEDRKSIDAIHRALDAGINWIDTAAVYGLGHSEEVVGTALKSITTKPWIFTKGAMTWGADRKIVQTLKKKIREEVEGSLRRLNVEVIDLYQIHWPVPDEEIEEGWTTMAELQREGKVRYVGVSNFSVPQMERALKIAPITSLQPPYSMINRSVEAEILPFCEKNGIGVINYSPMQSGLLTGAMTKDRIANMPQDDFRRNSKQFQEPLISRNLELVNLLRSIGTRHDVEPGVIAIAWTLHNPAITAAIVGGRSAEQVDGVLPAMTFRLSEEEFQQIGRFLNDRV